MKIQITQKEIVSAIERYVRARSLVPRGSKVTGIKFRFPHADRKTIYAEVEVKG